MTRKHSLALWIALAALVAGCQRTETWSVVKGANGLLHPAGCRLIGVRLDPKEPVFAIATVVSGEVPNEGATVAGDFRSAGEHRVHNDSADADLQVHVVFASERYAQVLAELKRRHCFGAPPAVPSDDEDT